ncbi:uncharacterized protein V6R79_002174 [Siganus canaliculatus]
MEVAALGRPFSLGMLYDCRNESLIPGMTLWGHSDLVKNIGERPQRYSDFDITTEESIEDKTSALNVSAALKASFCSGLVEVEGSAKYLKDDRKSNKKARVTLTYGATTKFQQLSMDHLGKDNLKYKDVFEHKQATHVVSGILYGAKAFFVFERDMGEDEKRSEVQGKMNVMIKKIPSIDINSSGQLELKEKESKSVEKFTCRFHGDFLLEKTPASFQDAVQVYQNLSKMLGPNGENAVPMKVWLLPLAQLQASASLIVRDISPAFLEEVQTVLEDLKEVDIRCNDALSTTAQQFSQMGRNIKTFKDMCSGFKLEFQRFLAKKLPLIRGGEESEEEVLHDVQKMKRSPFSSSCLNEWMDAQDREIFTLKSLTRLMKNTKIVPSETELYREALSAENAVCFVFTSLGSLESYVSTLTSTLGKLLKPDQEAQPDRHAEKERQWYAVAEVAEQVRRMVKLFSDFAEANKEKENIKFLAVGMKKPETDSSIYLYQNGFPVNKNYEPPSKPRAVMVRDQSHHSVTLEICPPEFGVENITSYSAEYCVSGEDEWQQQAAERPGEVTVTGLKPNTDYKFRCRAVTSVGVGPVCEASARTSRGTSEHHHSKAAPGETSKDHESTAARGTSEDHESTAARGTSEDHESTAARGTSKDHESSAAARGTTEDHESTAARGTSEDHESTAAAGETSEDHESTATRGTSEDHEFTAATGGTEPVFEASEAD